MKRLIAFDLDGTLAESKQPLSAEMAAALAALLRIAEVAIISGGDWPQFEKQIVDRLAAGTRREGLWLMPATGTKLYRFENGWRTVYAELFDAEEKQRIRAAFDDALAGAGFANERIWGEQLQDRGSQFTFSALGQDAPLAAKEKWDPDRAKRTALQADLRGRLPGLSIKLGGTTSIDVTRAGVDKAYALRRLTQESGIPIAEMLFFGDAIYPGGNDLPACDTGIDAIRVRDPAESLTCIATIIACQQGPGRDNRA